MNKVLPGQACSVEYAIKTRNIRGKILIGSCDNGIMYNQIKLHKLIKENPDIVVFTFTNSYAAKKNPNMYSWVDTDQNDNIKKVNVKKFNKNKDPLLSKAIVGAFFFKNSKVYLDSMKNLYKKKIKTNNEYYIDNLINESINLGYSVKNFLVDEYICWGTPNDYETFRYWQDFFQK